MSRRSSRLHDYTLTNVATKANNGNMASPTNNANPNFKETLYNANDKNGTEQETANLITIEATEHMIKVESHQL